MHADFSELESVKNLISGYDACYHCMGVSAAGMSEDDYRKMTYDFSLALTKTLFELNPNMTFTCVSGQGTDETQKSRSMRVRVKGKTENDISAIVFRQAFMFRLGGIIPMRREETSSK